MSERGSRYQCSVCGYIYDPSRGIAPKTYLRAPALRPYPIPGVALSVGYPKRNFSK